MPPSTRWEGRPNERARNKTPDLGHDRHEQRRLIFAIHQFGFTDFYVQKIAEAACRAARVSQWLELPPQELEKLRYTIKARAGARDVKANKAPRPEAANCPF